jgi:phenazine biosynthesis protein phzE
VLHRAFTGQIEGATPRQAVLAYLAALLRGEQGSYWTYAVQLGDVALAGASPERHLTIKDGLVTMNPISGTYRHPAGGPEVDSMLSFLTDAKEVDELFMVVDEELKLMATVCPSGGRVIGPFLKPMSRVTHTEYLLEGRSDLDPREVLRQTMFAPTVTGAPMANACRVIKKLEGRGRGYYAGTMVLFEPRPSGGHNLDAPILIRTAYVDPAGQVKVPAGATLVRNSDPMSEVAETATKAAGVLAAIGAIPGEPSEATAITSSQAVASDPRVKQTLDFRNERLSPFWLQDNLAIGQPLSGRLITVVDAEDGFSQMLAHQLRRLGARVQVVGWDAMGSSVEQAGLLVAGPGPGDPDSDEPRIQALRAAISARLESGRPLLAVCLSHQILCRLLGLDLRALARPRQGEQLTDNIFGISATLGYYNSFTAAAPLEAPPGLEFARRAGTDEVIALRGPTFASLQGHPESALSTNGTELLGYLVAAR